MPQVSPESAVGLLASKADITALSILGKHTLLAQRDTADIGPVIAASATTKFTAVQVYAQAAPVTTGTCTLDVKVNGVSILAAPPFDLTSLTDEQLLSLTLTQSQFLVSGDLLSILVTTSDDAITSNGLAVIVE